MITVAHYDKASSRNRQIVTVSLTDDLLMSVCQAALVPDDTRFGLILSDDLDEMYLAPDNKAGYQFTKERDMRRLVVPEEALPAMRNLPIFGRTPVQEHAIEQTGVSMKLPTELVKPRQYTKPKLTTPSDLKQLLELLRTAAASVRYAATELRKLGQPVEFTSDGKDFRVHISVTKEYKF